MLNIYEVKEKYKLYILPQVGRAGITWLPWIWTQIAMRLVGCWALDRMWIVSPWIIPTSERTTYNQRYYYAHLGTSMGKRSDHWLNEGFGAPLIVLNLRGKLEIYDLNTIEFTAKHVIISFTFSANLVMGHSYDTISHRFLHKVTSHTQAQRFLFIIKNSQSLFSIVSSPLTTPLCTIGTMITISTCEV